MYQALYRKYRPRTFSDLVGQEHITRTLKNQIASGCQSHAYLFTGPRGTGKTSCSKILAKAVNCQSPLQGDPCGHCDLCRGIDDGSVLDVAEIDAASNNGVENIRQLREEAAFTPSTAKYRVFILDECHMLSPGAVNALLKILEEPPQHVLFVLATTELHKVLPTILSRCQRFDFRRIRPDIIAQRLLSVCQQENLSLTPQGAQRIAQLSDGGLRDALSMLDLCTAYADIIDETVVESALGLAADTDMLDLLRGLLAQNRQTLLSTLAQALDKGGDPLRLTGQLLEYLRRVLLLRILNKPEDLLSLSSSEQEQLRSLSDALPEETVLGWMDRLHTAQANMSRTTFKRMELELALVRCCTAVPPLPQQLAQTSFTAENRFSAAHTHNAVPPAPTENRQSRQPLHPASASPLFPADGSELPPENAVSAFSIAPPSAVQKKPSPEHAMPAPPSAADPTPVSRTRSTTPAAPEGDKILVTPEPRWSEIVAALQPINPLLHGAMKQSRGYWLGSRVLVDCDSPMFLELLRTSVAAKEALRKAIAEVTGQTCSLGPYRPEKYQIMPDNDPLDELVQRARHLGVDVSAPIDPGSP